MTKNVEQDSSRWRKMKSALASLTGGSGSYGTSSYGGMSSGASNVGFKRDVEQLVSISESAKKLIQDQDSDGVIHFRYHDEQERARQLQGKLEALEKYSGNVSLYLKNRIDQPFYTAIDAVGAKLESLSISSYKTSNTIGYKRTETVTDVYGHPMGTREVTPDEIGLEQLYLVDNPYRDALQKSYQDFKMSDAYKENKLTETEYVMASHHTRAFNYDSIRDKQESIELWRDVALAGGLVILSFFCPPAAMALGASLFAAETYSVASGKDWGTGRKLDRNERILRGVFMVFDLVPGCIYLFKAGRQGGLAASKAFVKQTLKEGFEQGTRNLDTAVKYLSHFGDNVLKQMDNLFKQGDQFLNKVLTKGADQLSAGLKHLDGQLSQAARNFRLNLGLEPQLVDGALSSGGGSLDNLAGKLDDFSKNQKLRMASAGGDVGSQTLKEVPYGQHIIKGKYGKKILAPNVKYVSDEGYEYVTDSLGRITSVKAHDLVLDPAGRNLYSQRRVGGANRLADDDGGHLIASMFKGSGDIDNLIAMNSQINRKGGVWYEMEQEWRKALSEVPPKKVSVSIEPVYSGNSLRPTEFKVKYHIEGQEPIVRRIRNQVGG